MAAIFDFEFFHGVLYSTSQALSFDIHIEGVEKKYVIRHFVKAAILDLEFFMVYCILLVKPFHLIPILRELKKKSTPPFCGGGHLGFGMFSWCALYSTSQALSLNTHIEGVKKIYVVIRHFVAAAILDLQ